MQYTDPSDTTVAANRFRVDGKEGGWGAYTMGLLTVSASMGKSYGLFGSAAKVAARGATAAITSGSVSYPAPAKPYVPGYDPGAHGYVYKAAEMVDATSTAKYVIVSVWANTLLPEATAPTGAFSIEFSSNKWADYGTTTWAAPAAPAAASVPASLGAR